MSLWNTAQSWFNNVAESWYQPIAGHYDAAQTSSPSYSPANFMGQYYAPSGIYSPDIFGSGDPATSDPVSKPSTSSGVFRVPARPQTIDYLNAELAKHYGMSAETAYQEALANTSYQRAVKDMQASGLNPAVIFGSGRGSGADGVSYVASGTTGSGPSGGTTAKSNKKDNLFSEGAYYGIAAAIGLLVAGITKSPTGYWIGSQAAQGAMGAANAGYKSRR